MSKVMDALLREHGRIADVLGVLEREVGALAALKDTDEADYALMTSAVEYFAEFPDRRHHPKEDLVFARLKQADPAAAQGVGDLLKNHAALAQELRAFADALRAVMNEAILPRHEFVEKARTFIEHQRLHLTMEEIYFFPVAEEKLDQTAWDALEKEMSTGDDPLIGGAAGERFEALRRSITRYAAEARRSAGD